MLLNTHSNLSATILTALQMSIVSCKLDILFSISNVSSFLASVSTKVDIVQYPILVDVGESVTLTCNVTAERKIEDLKWTDSDRRELRKGDKGVVDLHELKLEELSASSVLKLSVKDKNGDEWPKNVTCKVELEPEKKGSPPVIYDATVVVNVTGKCLWNMSMYRELYT